MKKVLFTLVLCVGFWSIPASAAPFDIPAHARAMREVGRAIRLHHVDANWRSPAALPSVVHVRIRSHETPPHRVLAPAAMPEGSGLGLGMRLDTPHGLNAVAGIPEPSSTILFGIGVLVALQAIPRKSSLDSGPAAGQIADRA